MGEVHLLLSWEANCDICNLTLCPLTTLLNNLPTNMLKICSPLFQDPYFKNSHSIMALGLQCRLLQSKLDTDAALSHLYPETYEHVCIDTYMCMHMYVHTHMYMYINI